MEKVSIIIPFYNEIKYIDQCLDSVLKQSYKNIEILLINNNIKHKNSKVLKKYKDKRIKIYNCSEKGVSYARNMGIKKATGRYICFLDADDYYAKDKIKKQVEFMQKNNYYFTYGDYMFVTEEGIDKKRVKVPKSLNYQEALKNTTIFTSTVMIDTKKIDKEIIYMPLIKRGQDTATWWQILKTGVIAYGMNELLAYYRTQNKSLSSNKFIALKRTWDIYKLQDMNLIKRIYCFIFYVIRAIKRRI